RRDRGCRGGCERRRFSYWLAPGLLHQRVVREKILLEAHWLIPLVPSQGVGHLASHGRVVAIELDYLEARRFPQRRGEGGAAVGPGNVRLIGWILRGREVVYKDASAWLEHRVEGLHVGLVVNPQNHALLVGNRLLRMDVAALQDV